MPTDKRRPHYRTPLGVVAKKRGIIESLNLLQLLCCEPVTQQQADDRLGLPRREFYRHLVAFRLAGLTPAKYRQRDGRVAYSLSVDMVIRWLREASCRAVVR